jgi:HK97 gp10 family phage protein
VGSSSFTFDTSKFKDLKAMDRRLNRAIFGVAKYWDGRVEAHMKHKAPWTDRTTNARNGLFAKAYQKAKGLYAIILAHSVTYGIYLELGTRYMRARPIIIPTMRIYAPKVMRTLTKILDRL